MVFIINSKCISDVFVSDLLQIQIESAESYEEKGKTKGPDIHGLQDVISFGDNGNSAHFSVYFLYKTKFIFVKN